MLVDHSLSETAQNASSVPRLPTPRVPPGFFRVLSGYHRDRPQRQKAPQHYSKYGFVKNRNFTTSLLR